MTAVVEHYVDFTRKRNSNVCQTNVRQHSFSTGIGI